MPLSVWTEDCPGAARGWHFVLLNLLVRHKNHTYQGAMVRLSHGGTCIRHCTTKTMCGAKNIFYGFNIASNISTLKAHTPQNSTKNSINLMSSYCFTFRSDLWTKSRINLLCSILITFVADASTSCVVPAKKKQKNAIRDGIEVAVMLGLTMTRLHVQRVITLFYVLLVLVHEVCRRTIYSLYRLNITVMSSTAEQYWY